MKSLSAHLEVIQPVRGSRWYRNGVRALAEFLEPRVLLSGVTPNDPQIAGQYWVNKIDAPDAWNITAGSNTVVVAVLDSGFDTTHPDLAVNLWTNPNEVPGDGIDNDGDGLIDDVHGWNFLNNSNNVQDNNVHGTSVAGVIGAVGNNGIGTAGVNWNVQILPVEVGTLTGVNDDAVAAGINYITKLKKQGVNIVAINASYISFTPPTFAEINAISNAGKNGILYVAAAGNSSLNLDDLYPSSFIPSNMIFVAATDASDNLASFSSYGSKTVAVGAPGVDITTTIPGGGYLTLSGTSYAAPMVSGIAALLKSQYPSATMQQIKTAILTTGDLDPALAGKTITGRRVNAFNALESLAAHASPAPTGVVESVIPTAVTGWAQAPGSVKPTQVKLYVDGKLFKTASANINRPDLTATLGSPKHGFNISLKNLKPGIHRLDLYAVDSATHALVLLGDDTLSTNTPANGLVESLTASVITGYAFDANAGTKAIQVRYTIDGGTPVFINANLSRPDLKSTLGSPKHGFNIALPQLTAGDHTIAVEAVDPNSDQLMPLTSQTLTVGDPAGNPLPTGTISTFTSTTIAGAVTDANATTPLALRIDIDGKRGKSFTTTATVDPTTDTFTYTLPKLRPGTHRVDVYALDNATNTPNLLARQLVNFIPSTATIDSATTTSISGTASSPSAKKGQSLIRIDIDSLVGAALPVGNTFSLNLPPLPTGSHHVTITLIDPVTFDATVLSDGDLLFA